jgi:hypothetical protein
MRRWQSRKATGALQSPGTFLVDGTGSIVAPPEPAKKRAPWRRLIVCHTLTDMKLPELFR